MNNALETLSPETLRHAREMAHRLAHRIAPWGSDRATLDEFKARADEALVEAGVRYTEGGAAAFTSYAYLWVRGALLRELKGAQRRRVHECRDAREVEAEGSLEAAILARQVLMRLHRQDRSLLWAHLVEGRSLASLAEGRSESTIRRRYHLALRRARECVAS